MNIVRAGMGTVYMPSTISTAKAKPNNSAQARLLFFKDSGPQSLQNRMYTF